MNATPKEAENGRLEFLTNEQQRQERVPGATRGNP